MSIVKISFAAKELGVSSKTIYNWITDGKLTMPKSGYVSLAQAETVWIKQQLLRRELSFFMSQGTIRDAYGRFIEANPKEAK
jgi:excisionase family DNA binding protein